jgi:Tol biopolymer transport system component
MKHFFIISVMVCVVLPCFSQMNPVGIFSDQQDIGYVKFAGSSNYDPATQQYEIKGSGANIWFNADQFHFTYRKISGDFILTADFAFTGDTAGAEGHRKIGWMVRESVATDAASMDACWHYDGLTALQWREMKGSFMRDPQGEIFYPKRGLQTMQLERKGKTLIMRMANPGEPLQFVGKHELNELPDSVLAGIYICSHDSNTLAAARVWNVRIDRPVENVYQPNPVLAKPETQAVMGCRLEIIDIMNGNRKVIHESKGRFEAPNWMPDGKKLLFNEHGSLYTIPVEGGEPEKFNTGSAANLNNDHGISFDGKLLAISNSRPGKPGGGSSVYVLPLAGGEPRLLTEETPSYWHGWNPNNKEVCFVAQRGTKTYNIYKQSINGEKEIQLTFNKKGHVDGPEYSPDGKYIYYNANPTGTMQIWRMKPDGTGKEQITFDQYHNWFPHISPDGKWIVFISFMPDIDPNAHPSYQRVMFRIMPASGGAPRVLAYLYGGQGTINVPSWSPDSKHFAFVSNSE